MTGRCAGLDGDPSGVTTWEAIPAAHRPSLPIRARSGSVRRLITGRGSTVAAEETGGWTMISAAALK
jgi:hypothetical protein